MCTVRKVCMGMYIYIILYICNVLPAECSQTNSEVNTSPSVINPLSSTSALMNPLSSTDISNSVQEMSSSTASLTVVPQSENGIYCRNRNLSLDAYVRSSILKITETY